MSRKFINGATSVQIKAFTPTGIFCTYKLPLTEENSIIIAGILEKPEQFDFLKLPITITKVVILPRDVIGNTVFEVEWFDDSNGDNIIKLDTGNTEGFTDYLDMSGEEPEDDEF